MKSRTVRGDPATPLSIAASWSKVGGESAPGRRPAPRRADHPAEITAPARIGAPRNRKRSLVSFGHYDVARHPHERTMRLAQPRAFGAVAVDDDAHHRTQCDGHDVDVVCRRPIRVLGDRDSIP